MSALTDLVRAIQDEKARANSPGNSQVAAREPIGKSGREPSTRRFAKKLRQTRKALECGKLYRRIAEARRRNKKMDETRP